MNDSLLKKFASSALFVLIARVMAFVGIFGFNALLARALPPGEFGVFILLFSLLVVFGLVANFGLNVALVKLIAASEEDQSAGVGLGSLIKKSLVMVLAKATALGAVVAVLITYSLPASETVNPVAIGWMFGVAVVLRSVHLLMAESARGFHERIWSNMFGGPAGGPLPHILFLLMLGVGFFGFGPASLNLSIVFGCYVVAFLATTPVLAIVLIRLVKKRHVASSVDTLSIQESRESVSPTLSTNSMTLIALGFPLMLTQVLGVGIAQADIWIAGALAAPSALAMYAVAQRMLAFLTIPLQITNTAIIADVPQLFAQKKMERLQQLVSLAANVSALPALIIGSALLAFPGAILGAAFGSYYASGAEILQILVVGQLICVATGPCQVVLMMTGHEKTAMSVNVFAILMSIIGGLLGLWAFGLIGLACSVSITITTQNILNWWLVKKKVGIKTNFGSQPLNLSSLFRTLFLKRVNV